MSELFFVIKVFIFSRTSAAGAGAYAPQCFRRDASGRHRAVAVAPRPASRAAGALARCSSGSPRDDDDYFFFLAVSALSCASSASAMSVVAFPPFAH